MLNKPIDTANDDTEAKSEDAMKKAQSNLAEFISSRSGADALYESQYEAKDDE